jgi:menaquinone-dependent protoporphyrinogen oxidase
MRVLVSAASKHGASQAISGAIVEALTSVGIEAVALAPEQVRSLDGIDAAVIGSGVHAGRWLEPAKRLVTQHADELRSRPVWLFSSGPLGDPPKPEGEPADGAAMRELIGAREDRVFPGRIDSSDLSFGERLIVRAVKAPEGDYRPWPAIRDWATGIARELLGRPA